MYLELGTKEENVWVWGWKAWEKPPSAREPGNVSSGETQPLPRPEGSREEG